MFAGIVGAFLGVVAILTVLVLATMNSYKSRLIQGLNVQLLTLVQKEAIITESYNQYREGVKAICARPLLVAMTDEQAYNVATEISMHISTASVAARKPN